MQGDVSFTFLDRIEEVEQIDDGSLHWHWH